jgi:hypothetical protein
MIAVLQDLYRYLADKNYLIGNPWQGIASVTEARG